MDTRKQDLKIYRLLYLHCEEQAPRDEKMNGSLVIVCLQLPWRELSPCAERNKEGFRSWPLWKAAWARCRVGMSGHTAAKVWEMGPLLVFSLSPLCLVLAVRDLSQYNTSVRWNKSPEPAQGQQRCLTRVPIMETKRRKSWPTYSWAHRGGAKQIDGLVQCGMPIG